MTDPVTLYICTTCRREDDVEAGARLLEATQAGPQDGVLVRGVKCLANCKRGPSATMIRPDGWTYIFGGLDPAQDAPALLEGARLLGGSADGLMPWRGRPEALKRGMQARVPPLNLATSESAA